MFEAPTYTRWRRGSTRRLLVLYSDGITEAEDPEGQPLEEPGLKAISTSIADDRRRHPGTHIVKAVERYAQASRFTDDLTILILRRARSSEAVDVRIAERRHRDQPADRRLTTRAETRGTVRPPRRRARRRARGRRAAARRSRDRASLASTGPSAASAARVS